VSIEPLGGAGDPRDVSIQARCAWAAEQHRLHGARLRGDEVIARLLAELRPHLGASREAMVASGLALGCRICEEEEGGSCCGRGMEDHYDGVLLLVNLMLGAAIERERCDPESCLFLDSAGCRLLARDHICVNYLCAKARERISEAALAEMRRRQGLELDSLFRLTDCVTILLGRLRGERGSPPAPSGAGSPGGARRGRERSPSIGS
jgi:hypothetical protein